MTRYHCDFYCYKAGQLIARSVNGILSAGEAQATANHMLKQHGATHVCVTNRGAAGGPPRAPIKSTVVQLPQGTQCWIKAGYPQLPVYSDSDCPPNMVRVGGKCVPFDLKCYGKKVQSCDPGNLRCIKLAQMACAQGVLTSKGAAPQLSPFASPLATSFLRPQHVAGVPEMESSNLGLSLTEHFILVAYKGSKILKQWGINRKHTSGVFSHVDLADEKKIAKDYWSSAKSIGADRLCVSFTGGGGWVCYNGYGFTQGLLVPTAGQQIQCPTGQVWGNTTKKCVSAQSNADYSAGTNKPFKRLVQTASKSLQPAQETIVSTAFSTSSLRPQRVAGIEESPMFKWIENPKKRDERAIEARLHGIGRDEVDDERVGHLGATDIKQTAGYQACYGNLIAKCEANYQAALKDLDVKIMTASMNGDDAEVLKLEGQKSVQKQYRAACFQSAESTCLGQQYTAQGTELTTGEVMKLQKSINAFFMTLQNAPCLISEDGGLGGETCGAAIYAVANGATHISVPGKCNSIASNYSSDGCKKVASGGGGSKGGVAPLCDDSKCPPGQECCKGWPWCTNNTCVNKCPEGYARGADGYCKEIAASGEKKSNLGLILLGLVAGAGVIAAAAGAFYPKAPKLPPRDLMENAHKKRRKSKKACANC